MKRGFTLIELIVVIIIVGILAAVGLSQYSTIVEKGRLAEARVRIGAISKLAYEYYLNNGTFTGLGNDYLDIDNTCHTTDYYRYTESAATDTYANLIAYRCTTGGKPPSGPAYGLLWRLNSDGSLVQRGYYVSGGTWIYTDDWGGCCR